MSAKHTPGPWRSDTSGKVFGKDGTQIAQLLAGPDTPESFCEYDANDRLITAAPQMLEALELIQGFAWDASDDSDHAKEIRRRALAAIAKAKGAQP